MHVYVHSCTHISLGQNTGDLARDKSGQGWPSEPAVDKPGTGYIRGVISMEIRPIRGQNYPYGRPRVGLLTPPTP